MAGWLRRKRRFTGDFTDEVRAHLALETDRLIEEGMTPDEARHAARRAFGNVTAATERFHESRRILWLGLILAVGCGRTALEDWLQPSQPAPSSGAAGTFGQSGGSMAAKAASELGAASRDIRSRRSWRCSRSVSASARPPPR